jgi:hypothetical protein
MSHDVEERSRRFYSGDTGHFFSSGSDVED